MEMMSSQIADTYVLFPQNERQVNSLHQDIEHSLE